MCIYFLQSDLLRLSSLQLKSSRLWQNGGRCLPTLIQYMLFLVWEANAAAQQSLLPRKTLTYCIWCFEMYENKLFIIMTFGLNLFFMGLCLSDLKTGSLTDRHPLGLFVCSHYVHTIPAAEMKIINLKILCCCYFFR